MSLLLNLIFIWISLAIGYCLGDMGCFFFPPPEKVLSSLPTESPLSEEPALLEWTVWTLALPGCLPGTGGLWHSWFTWCSTTWWRNLFGIRKDFFFLAFIHSSFAFWLCEKKFLIESNPMNSIQTLHYWFFRPTHSIIPLHCWLSSVSIHHLLGDPRVIFFVFSQEGALTSIFPHPKLMIWIHVWLNRSATLLLCGSKQSTL